MFDEMNYDFYVFVSCGLQKATLAERLAERLAVPRMVGIVQLLLRHWRLVWDHFLECHQQEKQLS